MNENTNFKNHYDIPYKIGKKQLKIGILTDSQLFIGKNKLKSIIKPSKEQLEQLDAITYIIKQRSVMDQNKLIKDFNNNPIIKANKAKKLIIVQNTVDLIETWLKKTTKLYKFKKINHNERQNLQSHIIH